MRPDRVLVEAFRATGCAGKSVVGGVKVYRDSDRGRAVQTAHRLWPGELLPGELAQILPTPAHVEQAAALVTEEMVAKGICCGDGVAQHTETVNRCVRAGFDEVYVGQSGQNYRAFFDFYAEHVLPAVQA